MGGPNLEVFKFGMYIMFPIGWMYYFGTNLDRKFSVPGFWPSPEQTHKIPFEREDIDKELLRLRERRLRIRRERLEAEGVKMENTGMERMERSREGGPLDRLAGVEVVKEVKSSNSWADWIKGR